VSEKIAYTIKEAVTASGLGRTTIYELMKQGELPYVKIGARTLIRRSDLELMLERKVCNHDG
jgi:excisionase family DNA binding protein